MAKKTSNLTPSVNSEIKNITEEYQNNLGAMETTHASFDDKERILMSQPIDQISQKEARSKMTDPTLLSASLKQNNQEMAQMPSGKVIALTKENKGKSLFMDLILHNHVLPNANTQFDPFIKFWLLSFYRKVYGSFGVLVDFVDKKNYTGPDFSLLPARSIIPQAGKTTVIDSDYVDIRTRVGKSWLLARDDKYWENVDKVLATNGDSSNDINSQTYTERKTDASGARKEEWEIVTRYYNDRWVTFHPSTGMVLRDLSEKDNKSIDGNIPVYMCHSYPLLDRFFGLGDFERGMTLHAAQGALINLYMDGAKAGIFPFIKVDPTAIENWDDVKDGMGPGFIWLMKKNSMDGLQTMSVKPNLDTFQSTYNFLKATIMTVTGTSDTSVGAQTDPGFGKTPQALKMQAFTQGMQTQFGRRMLEITVEQVMDRMIDLIAKRQESDMEIYFKQKDLEAIKEVAGDVAEMFEVGNMGKIKIKHTEVNNTEYRYEIDQGSTTKKDEILENESLKELTGFVLEKIPGSAEALAGDGLVKVGSKKFDLGEAFKRITISSGVSDWDKIIIDDPNDESAQMEQPDQNALNAEDPQTSMAIQQALASGMVAPSLNVQPGQQPGVQPQPLPQPPTNQGFSDPAINRVLSELQSIQAGGVK